MAKLSIRRGCLVPCILLLVLLFTSIAYVWRDRRTFQDTLSYSTRPLWDKPEDPQQLLPHFTADTLRSDDAEACRRHGWPVYAGQRTLIDAILFSTELELLEIRLRELWDVVDVFVIVESTHDLMGQKKVGRKGKSTKTFLAVPAFRNSLTSSPLTESHVFRE